MNSQAHKTLRWHTQPGCFWALVKQTTPTGCLCSVTVSGCGSLCWNADDLPRDAVAVPTMVKGNCIVADYLTKKLLRGSMSNRQGPDMINYKMISYANLHWALWTKKPQGSAAASKQNQERTDFKSSYKPLSLGNRLKVFCFCAFWLFFLLFVPTY